MRYGIFADIHSNIEALESVLDALDEEGVEKYICVGDIVGYGPNPKKCLRLIKLYIDDYGLDCIGGNHDYAVVEMADITLFNSVARRAIMWTKKQLDKTDINFLSNLKLKKDIGAITITHATLDSPGRWEYYLKSPQEIKFSFSSLKNPICFIGHTHIPAVYINKTGLWQKIEERELNIDISKYKYVVNVGSVGQSRNHDLKAVYVIYDDETQELKIKKVSYEVKKTQKKIIEAGLHESLASRLDPESFKELLDEMHIEHINKNANIKSQNEKI
jgi:predicted phosphodiesterase